MPKYEFKIKVGDTPIPTLAGYKEKIKEWLPQANKFLAKWPYNKEQVSGFLDEWHSYEKYLLARKVIGNSEAMKRYAPVQIAKMMELLDNYKKPTEQELAALKEKVEARPHVIWALDVVNKKSKMSNNEIKKYLERQEHLTPKDGDVIQIYTEERCKQAWDGALKKGRITQAQYSAAKLPDGSFKWSWGDEELFIMQGFVIYDEFTEQEIKEMLEKDFTEKPDGSLPDIHQFRKNKKIVIEQVTYLNSESKRVGLQSGTVSDMRNVAKQVAIRYDKPILKAEILNK